MNERSDIFVNLIVKKLKFIINERSERKEEKNANNRKFKS